MSKARPHAQIYEKWMRGICKAVPDAAERCALLEYIIQYQIVKVYEIGELPKTDTLSASAALAFAMIEGDLDELCEERTTRVKASRENGSKTGQTLNDPSGTQQDPIGPNGTESAPTIQSNTIQSNTKQVNNAHVLAHGAGLNVLKEFEIGFALLRKGYIVKAADLHAIYTRAAATKSPVAYAAKAFHEADDKAKLNVAANYLEATGCKDTRGLEMYGANLCQEGGEVLLKVRCTAAARDAIGSTGQDKAKTYLKSIGATGVSFVCNNN